MNSFYSKKDLNSFDKRFKANFINTISGYKSGSLIGTVNSNGVTNIAIFSSVVHVGSFPALLGFVMRPLTVPRHTYSNIIKSKTFTINQIHTNITGKAHFTSAKFDDNESEFKALELTEEFIDDFSAPFVKESHIKIGLRFQEEHELNNGCIFIVGSIEFAYVKPSAVKKDGSINLQSIDTVAISGLNRYYTGDFFEEYPYAKQEDIQSYLSKKPKDRSDNVVFNEETNKFDASLKKYSTDLGAPMIEYEDVNHWKNIGKTKVNKNLEARYKAIKKTYEETLELYELNQKIYNSKFNFEPIVGVCYHLYKKENEELFLSSIAPDEWDKDYQGSFELNVERIFEKVDFPKQNGGFKINLPQ